MPELPEVESFKRYVDNTSLHQTIETIRFAGKDLLLHTSEKKAAGYAHGQHVRRNISPW
jgi:formamidopyrimidine-DNA glycosylase